MTSRKPGLGRGLGALLPDATPKTHSSAVTDLEVSQILPNPRQPRTEFDRENLEELSASIREVGLLQPIVVRPREDGRYELLVGERRLRAAKLAGLQSLPALIREADDKEALEQALIENLQRSDLNALEEAQAYESLIEVFEMTQEQVAKRMGKSRTHVTNTLRLRELPETIKSYLAAGKLTAGHARAILAIPDNNLRESIAKQAAEGMLSVRDIESQGREMRQSPKGGSPPNKPQTKRRSRFPDLEDSLADRFSTDIAIEIGRGRGRIVVHFGSRDDLDRIARLMLEDTRGRDN